MSFFFAEILRKLAFCRWGVIILKKQQITEVSDESVIRKNFG